MSTSTDARATAVHNPIRWFMAGAAMTLVAGALAGGVAMANLLPATQPDELGSVPAAGSLLDEGLRMHRKDEIDSGRASADAGLVWNLTDHRKGEIDSER